MLIHTLPTFKQIVQLLLDKVRLSDEVKQSRSQHFPSLPFTPWLIWDCHWDKPLPKQWQFRMKRYISTAIPARTHRYIAVENRGVLGKRSDLGYHFLGLFFLPAVSFFGLLQSPEGYTSGKFSELLTLRVKGGSAAGKKYLNKHPSFFSSLFFGRAEVADVLGLAAHSYVCLRFQEWKENNNSVREKKIDGPVSVLPFHFFPRSKARPLDLSRSSQAERKIETLSKLHQVLEEFYQSLPLLFWLSTQV